MIRPIQLLLAITLCVAPAFAQTTAPSGPPAAKPAPVAAATSPGPGKPARLPTSQFSDESGISRLSLSPDGLHIAFKATARTGKVSLAVLETDGRKLVETFAIPDKFELEWFRWAGNRRVLVSMSTLGDFFDDEVRYTRLFVYDMDTRALSYVGKPGIGVIGDDVIYTDPQGQFVLLSMQRDVFQYPTVWRFPLDGTAAKQGKIVQSEKSGVWNWYADSSGTVRIGIETLDFGGIKVWYRSKPGDDLRSIAKLTADSKDEQIWDVVRIISGSDEGYVLKADEGGRMALRKFNYATRAVGETIFAAPDGYDVDDVYFDENDKLLAAVYADEQDRIAWFDPAMKATQARLERAMKGQQVWVTSRSRDGAKMVVWAGSGADPGSWYIYDAKRSAMDFFFAEKQALDVTQLVHPKPVQYKARDGATIRGYLTLPMGRAPKGLPLIILPHGGPYGVRDKLEFNTEVQFLANRGYAVFQPNYRGSSGFGTNFEELGRGQIGRKMQDDLDDAMDWVVSQGLVDPKRVCVVGSSYGGYAALWAVIRNPERYRCAASFAGVTEFKQQLRYDAKFLSRDSSNKFRRRVQGEDKSFDLDLVSPAKQVARLSRPVLLAHGEKDTRVPFRQFKLMRDAAAKAGKPIELLTFAEEAHGFEKPENEARWLDALDAFLARNNPAD